MSLPDWTPTDEMYDLVSKYCEQQLSDAEATKLTALLRGDWRVRAFLVNTSNCMLSSPGKALLCMPWNSWPARIRLTSPVTLQRNLPQRLG